MVYWTAIVMNKFLIGPHGEQEKKVIFCMRLYQQKAVCTDKTVKIVIKLQRVLMHVLTTSAAKA